MPAYNVTSSFEGMATFANWIPLVSVVVIASFVIMLIMFFLSSAARYKKLEGFLGWLGSCCRYFAWGLLAETIGAGLWLISVWISIPAKEGGIDWYSLLFWAGITVAFFFGTAGLGLVFKKGIKKIQAMKKKIKKECAKNPPAISTPGDINSRHTGGSHKKEV